MFADLHLHSTFSDGSDTPAELAEKLVASNIAVCALTDHDSIAGLPSLQTALRGRVRLINGVEFSCIENGKTTHILGYGFAADSPEIQKTLDYGRELRLWNAHMRLDFLEKHHHIRFPDEDTAWMLSQNSPSRLHLVMLLIKHGYAASFYDAGIRYLDASKPYEHRLTAGDAISAILKAGAVPVWAHPLGGEGDIHTSAETLLPTLLSYGLRGMECYYSRYTAEEARGLITLAEKYDLLISGGSDYHGANKSVTLGMLSADKTTVKTDALSLLSVI